MAEEKSTGNKNLEDIMKEDLFSGSAKSELGEALSIIEEHAVPLGKNQLAAIAYLEYLDNKRKTKRFQPIIKSLLRYRKEMSTPKPFLKVIQLMFQVPRGGKHGEAAPTKGVKA